MRVDRKRRAVAAQADRKRPGMDGEAKRDSDQAVSSAARCRSSASHAGSVNAFVEVGNRRSSNESKGNSGGKVARFWRNGMRASFGIEFHVIRAADLNSFEAG